MIITTPFCGCEVVPVPPPRGGIAALRQQRHKTPPELITQIIIAKKTIGYVAEYYEKSGFTIMRGYAII
jgi:hypothetical protein